MQAHSPLVSSFIDRHIFHKIKIKRAILGMAQQDLANALSINTQEDPKDGNVERGISIGQLYIIADALNETPSWFVKDFGQYVSAQIAQFSLETKCKILSDASQLVQPLAQGLQNDA